jgi:hypothetical protein
MTPETSYVINFSLIVLEKIVCFILGYLTIRLGHNLIASGVKGEFKFSTKLSGMSADLASVSPGLLFVLLGAMLIGLAMFKDKEAHYNKAGAVDTSAIEIPPPEKF